MIGVLVCGALWTGTAEAVVAAAGPATDDDLFPKPAYVRRQVRFWEKVFFKYPSTTVVIHESSEPGRVIDVIDYKTLAAKPTPPGQGGEGEALPAPRKERDELTGRYLKRYQKALERFAREKEKALRHGPIETRLHHVYSRDPAALQRLYRGEIKLRAQTGLADDFLKAAAVAQAYFPYMEKVFHQYGVPTRLTRLAFVESMFNLKARSKVGASGIWQFMPETARTFVYVNHLVDERNSPYKATRAAAQLLLANYEELKSWPLAITAYNHGRVGMERAARLVGSSDIDVIIQRYESPSFGFASKNFYAEFLAAASTFERLQRRGAITGTHELSDTVPLILQHPLSVDDLVRHTPITRQILAEHNPCILESTLGKNSDKPLPPFYELQVPRPLAHAAKTALQGLQEKRYARR